MGVTFKTTGTIRSRLRVASACLARLAGATLLLAASLSGPAAAALPAKAVCDSADSATVLQAMPTQPDLLAHAVWLSGDVLQWPGVQAKQSVCTSLPYPE